MHRLPFRNDTRLAIGRSAGWYASLQARSIRVSEGAEISKHGGEG
jgi:hypothetical protein